MSLKLLKSEFKSTAIEIAMYLRKNLKQRKICYTIKNFHLFVNWQTLPK